MRGKHAVLVHPQLALRTRHPYPDTFASASVQSLRHTSAVRQWPFWLLIAAWVCANCPQLAVTVTLAWAGEARHFSHQSRLHAEVARLLTHNATPPSSALVAETAPTEPFRPLISAEALLKKPPLAVEPTVIWLGPLSRASRLQTAECDLPEAPRPPPPHEPPRVAV